MEEHPVSWFFRSGLREAVAQDHWGRGVALPGSNRLIRCPENAPEPYGGVFTFSTRVTRSNLPVALFDMIFLVTDETRLRPEHELITRSSRALPEARLQPDHRGPHYLGGRLMSLFTQLGFNGPPRRQSATE